MGKVGKLRKPMENNPFYERKCPEWFKDAKLGIFIHWGPYSVPGWATTEKGLFPQFTKALVDEGYDIDSINLAFSKLPELMLRYVIKGRFSKIKQMLSAAKKNPYAEWYWNNMEITDACKAYHELHWPNVDYTDFGEMFQDASKDWNPDDWSELFSEAGAKYVITTSKHHDGYCLWPTETPNPQIANWYSDRDLIGDLRTSLLSKDIRFALYYSAGYDWGYGGPMRNMFKGILQSDDAIDYFDKHLNEIIEKYRPSLIWQDIGYPKNGDYNKILSNYYDKVPDGVVNDRGQTFLTKNATRHFDYTTTEYFVPQSIRETPWEICRGITSSFGYNQMDNESTILDYKELVFSLADIISKNGNLLLGLGPMADGTIPELQAKVVRKFGEWVEVNKEGIFGTRPYKYFSDITTSGQDVRFTVKNEFVYAFVIGGMKPFVQFSKTRIKDGSKVSLLGKGDFQVQRGKIAGYSDTNPAGSVFKIRSCDITPSN